MSSTEKNLHDAARTWLAGKAAAARVRDPKNSDDARRDDLCRFARGLAGVNVTGRYHLRSDLALVSLADITPGRVRRARESMEAKYSTTTVARTMTTVRGFVLWLVESKMIAGDDAWVPVLRADRIEHDPVEQVLSVDDVTLMLDAAAEPGSRDWSAWPARDTAIVAVLAQAGLRASELCALEIRNLERGADVALRVDANGRVRRVPLDAPVVTLIDRYLAERRAEHTSPALFVRVDGGELDRSFVTRLVRRVANQVGVRLPAAAAVHALRHHHGVQLAARGAEAAEIAALLGHADGRMAAKYIAAAARVFDPTLA